MRQQEQLLPQILLQLQLIQLQELHLAVVRILQLLLLLFFLLQQFLLYLQHPRIVRVVPLQLLQVEEILMYGLRQQA